MNLRISKIIMAIEQEITERLNTMAIFKNEETEDGLPHPSHTTAHYEWNILKNCSEKLHNL